MFPTAADYVIVGAGSAGCVLANRLTEDPGTSVILIEAGGKDSSLNVKIPLAFPNQFHGPLDWDYETDPEPACHDRRLYVPRGKSLGGSSSMNAMLYVRGHEGRGIGLVNKLRAYRLQDEGFDTLEANRRLGLPAEARDFPVAARMLALLGVREVRLLTNNPAKLAGLQAQGIAATRVAHRLPANPHNAHYLDVKKAKSGHLD